MRDGPKRELSTKQKRFIAAYNGNATAAALEAGYSPANADKIGAQLLKNPRIIEAIRAREAERNADAIATREERQKFFTKIMRDEEQPTRDRIRATELLGKSEGDFVDRQEITGKDGRPLVPGEPVKIEFCFVDALHRADGTNINPDECPEEYAEAWLKYFFTDKGKREKLREFADKLNSGAFSPSGRALNVSEIQ